MRLSTRTQYIVAVIAGIIAVASLGLIVALAPELLSLIGGHP